MLLALIDCEMSLRKRYSVPPNYFPFGSPSPHNSDIVYFNLTETMLEILDRQYCRTDVGVDLRFVACAEVHGFLYKSGPDDRFRSPGSLLYCSCSTKYEVGIGLDFHIEFAGASTAGSLHAFAKQVTHLPNLSSHQR